MNQAHRPQRFTRRALAAAVIAACAAPAFALDFKTESGWEGNLKTDLSVSSSWRVEKQHKDLVGSDNAAQAGLAASEPAAFTAGYTGTGGEGDLNFYRGDNYSTLFKVISEVSLSKGDMGGMIRVKAWYDNTLNNKDAKFGNQPNGYNTNQPLSDSTFPALNRFDGIALLDAYVYNTFDVAGKPLQVRLGRQAINWGESIFIQGANQLSPIDLTALNKAGTQIKEALMPVLSIDANASLGGGASLEGFYQFKWEGHNIENCGTYHGGDGAAADPGKCDLATSPLINAADAQAGNSYISFIKHPKPRDSGQWGLALRFPVESLDTEVGAYAMNYHSRTPYLSGNVGGDLPLALAALDVANGAGFNLCSLAIDATNIGICRNFLLNAISPGVGIPMTAWRNAGFAFANSGSGALAGLAPLVDALIAGGLPVTNAFFEFPEDIKLYALSASTTMAGWSIGAEVSYSPNTPVQLAAGDFSNAVVAGTGPFGTNGVAGGAGLTGTGSRLAGTLAPNSGYVRGWERTHKTQLQFNGLNTIPAGFLGSTGGLFIGEVGFQWAGIQNSNGMNKRYGRAFTFDAATHASYGGACPTASGVSGDPIPTGCANDGFMTDFAWGYRLHSSLTYPGFMGTGWQFEPSIFWSHDVKGYSIDYQFLEDRKTLSLTAGFSLNNEHHFELNYTTYANNAKFDASRDKDNASVVYRYTF